ncbi:type IV pili methyl-accepting chemotaxis transducer N-terminal domain-containing protein [Asticcacaulis machinosus]|uniref:Type IV pili methyl-accepting chemotaxis transducer N-terminal domain-containing protein n=1 Tax=Asticcacaulis machinosus TaxID=2984211 RepID=A0ABT5HGV7_9CAUL|nr:type IV pili methyl-accepting chemotaxis transducer N-terminal domain-containing protein [Asticcacaulis machinosus]MDC7675432.1 type IV pili methyl-accepting chemotaxis transducer N-terminal domain-containing protein [Asticcacaulis machinosus]
MPSIAAATTGAPSMTPAFSSTTLINLAGRQRMLSQRIGLLLMLRASQSATPELAFETDRTLDAAITTFEASYALICDGRTDVSQPVTPLPHLKALLASNCRNHPQKTVHQRFSDFIATARRWAEDLHSGREINPLHLGFFVSDITGPILERIADTLTAIEADIADIEAGQAADAAKDRARVMKAAEQIATAANVARMISFNARISAARAGEFGREFTALTNEIKAISDDIQAASKDIVAYMQAGTVSRQTRP